MKSTRRVSSRTRATSMPSNRCSTPRRQPHVVLRRICARGQGNRRGWDERACSRRANLRFHHHAGGLSFHAAVSDGDEHSGILPERAARRLRRAGHHVCDALSPVRRSGRSGRAAVYQSRTARGTTTGRGSMSHRSGGCSRITHSAARPIARAIWIRWNFYFGNLEPWRMPTCSRAFQQEFNLPRRFLRYDPYDNQSGERREPDAQADRG